MKKKRTNGKGSRNLRVLLKSAKGRSLSSARWLERQLNDPYVQAAKREGYRSRAAYKLIELDERFRFLGKGKKIVDLGAAPGGWTQVAVARAGTGKVVALDINEMDNVAGAEFFQCDFMDDRAGDLLKKALGGPADLVLSDMAPPATGHNATDHLRIMALVEAAAHFAMEVLSPGGAFVAKVFQGGTERDLLALLKKKFAEVRHAKPPASRSESAETYVVATGFRPEK